MTEVKQQVRIIGMFGKRGAEVSDGLRQLTGFDLCNAQGLLGADTLQMRNGLGGIAVSEKCIAQKLMSDQELGAELQCPFQRNDCSAIVMFFHVSGAEVHKSIS